MQVGKLRTEDRFFGRHQAAWRRVAGVTVLAAGLAGACSAARADVDPFYLESFRQGAEAYARGSFEEAEQHLRIASFGMLDEPLVLADALVRLALARAELDDRDAFLEAFGRVDQVEELFSGYSLASIPQELRSLFEARVTRWVSTAVLKRSSTFAQLYLEQERRRIETLAPRDRIAELQRIVSENPDDTDWRLALSAARVENGDGRDAIADLDKVLMSQPDRRRATCLLGRAFLQIGQCDGAFEQVLQCDIRRLPGGEVVRYVDCLADAQRWSEAASVIVSLPSEARSSRALSRREKRIARNIAPETEIEPLPPFVPDPTEEQETPTAQAQSLVPAVPLTVEQSRIPQTGLDALRRRLENAASLADLDRVTTEAEDLRRRYPEAREPLYMAGEAAYRSSDWQRAVDYLGAADDLPEERPELLFYLSVSLFELGDLSEAAGILRRALPGLQRTPIVERYVRSILGQGR